MEERHLAARARLRDLQCEHPEWTHQHLADEIGYSLGWIRKWRRRLRQAAADDETVLLGQSRARRTPPPGIAQEVIDRILEIRDHPPENLRRTPGPVSILYYLHKDEALKVSGVHLPTSTRTIWRILDRNGRIVRSRPPEHEPVERPAPLVSWQCDFKDVPSVPPEPEGKQQHVVETLNVVDVGTSILLDAHVRADFTMETTLLALAQTLQRYGIPQSVRIDRDPRFVGSQQGRDFPSPFMRFLLCWGIEVLVCPPRSPDLNAFVERYHRSYKYECLQIFTPTDLEQTCEVTLSFQYHYNYERPNQALTCANWPPRVAFPVLPELPALPTWVDPDRWVWAVKGKHFVRKVRSDGTVTVDLQRYYIKSTLAGRYVALLVDAPAREFVVYQGKQVVKRFPIKGLYGGLMTSEAYLEALCREIRTQRRWQATRSVTM